MKLTDLHSSFTGIAANSLAVSAITTWGGVNCCKSVANDIIGAEVSPRAVFQNDTARGLFASVSFRSVRQAGCRKRSRSEQFGGKGFAEGNASEVFGRAIFAEKEASEDFGSKGWFKRSVSEVFGRRAFEKARVLKCSEGQKSAKTGLPNCSERLFFQNPVCRTVRQDFFLKTLPSEHFRSGKKGKNQASEQFRREIFLAGIGRNTSDGRSLRDGNYLLNKNKNENYGKIHRI